jgi:hypothetical protein
MCAEIGRAAGDALRLLRELRLNRCPVFFGMKWSNGWSSVEGDRDPEDASSSNAVGGSSRGLMDPSPWCDGGVNSVDMRVSWKSGAKQVIQETPASHRILHGSCAGRRVDRGGCKTGRPAPFSYWPGSGPDHPPDPWENHAMPRQKVIDAELVREAGRIVEQALDTTDVHVQSPGLDQLAAARREQDPAARMTKTVAALRQGARDLKAARDNLRERQRGLPAPPEGAQFTPEARRELDALKEYILVRVRRRAEEEMAHWYPEETGGKRRPPPRRRMSV